MATRFVAYGPLTTGSMFVEHTHTLTLNSTAVRAWGYSTSPGNVPACPRIRGESTLDEGVHNTCIPFLLGPQVQFRAPYLHDTAGIERVHPLVCVCSSTLKSLEIRGSVCSFPAATINLKQKEIDDVPRIGGWGTPLTPKITPSFKPFTSAPLYW